VLGFSKFNGFAKFKRPPSVLAKDHLRLDLFYGDGL
jgi:hypothetical protein